MKKALRRILRAGAIVAGLMVLLISAAALLIRFNKPLIKGILESQIAKRTGVAVRIGKLDYDLFPLRVTAADIAFGQENAFLKIKLALSRLTVAGDLRKALRGEKAAFRLIEAEGVVIDADWKTAPKEAPNIEALRSRATEALAGIERISLKDVRLSVSLPSGGSIRTGFDLSLTGKDANRDFVYSLSRGHVDFDDRAKAVRLEGGLETSGKFRLDPSFVIDAGLELGPATVEAPGIGKPLTNVTVEAGGRFDLASGEIVVSRLKLDIPGLAGFEGTARGMGIPGSPFKSEATVRFDKLESLAALVDPRLPAGLRGARISGRAVMSGKYEMIWPRPGTGDRLAASVAFDDVKLEHALSGVPVRASISGRLEIEGPLTDPRFSTDIRSSLGGIAREGLAVGDSDIRIIATGTKEAVDIPRFDASLGSLDYEVAEGRKISFEKASFSGRARLDLERKTLTLVSLEGRLSDFPPFTMTGRFGLDKGTASEARFECRGLDISAVRALGAPFLPADFAAWDAGGAADLVLEAHGPLAPANGLGLSVMISLSKVRFNDPTFLIAGEGLDPVIKLDGVRAVSGGLSFTGSVDIHSGESLVKSVYIPWATHPMQVTFGGFYDPASGVMDRLTARFSLPTIGEAEVSGSIGTRPKPAFDLRAKTTLRLEPLYSLYAQAGAAPESRMKIEGTLGADLTAGNTGGALIVKGRLNLTGAALELPSSGVIVSGLSAGLPVHIEAGGAAPPAVPGQFPEEGFFRIDEFHSPILGLKSIAASLRGGANAYELQPLALDLFGGALELGRTTILIDPGARTFRGIGALALKGIDISLFPVQLPGFRLTGIFRADFPRLDIGPKEIVASGLGEADVFGGKVVLRNLAVTDPFTPGRSIGLDVDLLDIDLKKLTDEVPFGEVTGIVRGGISGLVISYGQPARFDFRIESVPRRGVARTFSLKAVDNLTILSGGQEASGGTSPFWARFIRGFRYKKLGIVSTLRNDTFTLNGTIREGGVEYLVKKPALFGINVVNKMPEKSISFKEMTSRLKRVGRSAK